MTPEMRLEFEKVQQPTIGLKYHCAWAYSRALVWRLIGFTGPSTALLESKQGKRVSCSFEDLRETNNRVKIKITNSQKKS